MSMAPISRAAAVLKPASELEREYAVLIRQTGTGCQRVVLIMPPRDTDGEAEVLYLDSEKQPMTAYITDREGAPPLICSGW
jgi:hypothetical protein